MKLKIRLRVRTLMAIVAFVALGFGVAFELGNRAEQHRLLRRQADRFREAAIHNRRALECQAAEERQDPYRPAERAKLLAGERVRSPMPTGGFRSWPAELAHHQYWGTRNHDEADGPDAHLKAIEARLLPVLTGR